MTDAQRHVEVSWLVGPTGKVLHHATLTPAQGDQLTADGVLDSPFAPRTTCGRAIDGLTLTPRWRRGLPRCTHCCRVTGYPDGPGTPAADPACADVLARRLEEVWGGSPGEGAAAVRSGARPKGRIGTCEPERSEHRQDPHYRLPGCEVTDAEGDR